MQWMREGKKEEKMGNEDRNKKKKILFKTSLLEYNCLNVVLVSAV